jgi:acetyltransferase
MVNYRRNQDLLLETPDSLPPDFFPDTNRAKAIIEAAFAENRSLLSESEAKDLLGCYGVPVVGTRVCVTAMEAVIAADELGYPVALKIRSPQIPHPTTWAA